MDHLTLGIKLEISRHVHSDEDWEQVKKAFQWNSEIYDSYRFIHLKVRALEEHLRRRTWADRLACLQSISHVPYHHLPNRYERKSSFSLYTEDYELYPYDEAMIRFWRRVDEAEQELRRSLLSRGLKRRPNQEALVDAHVLPTYSRSMDPQLIRLRWLYEQSNHSSSQLERRNNNSLPDVRLPEGEFDALLRQWRYNTTTSN